MVSGCCTAADDVGLLSAGGIHFEVFAVTAKTTSSEWGRSGRGRNAEGKAVEGKRGGEGVALNQGGSYPMRNVSFMVTSTPMWLYLTLMSSSVLREKQY